jgi:pyruvate dehydrogenase E2 component (dihydrolipoamide acetyltransferase)
MPSLGADMEAGTLIQWLVKPGQSVKRGDIVATVETDKAAIDVEIWVNGVVGELLVSEGERVPVGAVLATIGGDSGAGASGAVEHAALTPQPPAVPKERVQPEVAAPAPVTPLPHTERARVSPLARATAERLGVDLSGVTGTGINGAITQADVERAARGTSTEAQAEVAAAPVARPEATARAASIRRAVATAMSRSHREIPHYYLAKTVDLGRTLDWLGNANRERPVTERIIPAALFVRAVALALHEIPEMNGYWLDDGFHRAERANVGFGVAIPGGGLIAPAILDADLKTLPDVMRELRDVVARARSGSLRSSEISDATITITSLGERGDIDTVFGLINPPQVALVGFGSVFERPWAENGMLAVRRQVTVSLSGDHRASDGHRGALFLAALDRLLREPEQL